jgi:hypothetical protein
VLYFTQTYLQIFFYYKKNTHFFTRILAAEVLDRGQEAIEWVTSKGKEKKEKKGTRAGAVGVVPGGCGAVLALENGKSHSTQKKKCILLFSGDSTDDIYMYIRYIYTYTARRGAASARRGATNSEKSRL